MFVLYIVRMQAMNVVATWNLASRRPAKAMSAAPTLDYSLIFGSESIMLHEKRARPLSSDPLLPSTAAPVFVDPIVPCGSVFHDEHTPLCN
jgi:hypothetical protein